MSNLLLMVIVGLAVGVFVISLGGGGGAIYLGVLTAIFQLSPGRLPQPRLSRRYQP